METIVLSHGEREMGLKLVQAVGWQHMHILLRRFPTDPRVLIRTYYEDGMTIPEASKYLDSQGKLNGLW